MGWLMGELVGGGHRVVVVSTAQERGGDFLFCFVLFCFLFLIWIFFFFQFPHLKN